MAARSFRVGSVAGILLLVTACAGRKPAAPVAPLLPALSTTKEDLLRRVDDLAARGAVWTTKADLAVVDLGTGKRRTVQVRMAARKPDHLRMQGTKTLLPTLFVLVANPDGVWLDVPPRNKTYHRPAGSAARSLEGTGRSLMAIEPADILRAMVPDPPAEHERWSLVEEPRRYRLQAFRWRDERLEPVRELIFDRTDLRLSEQRLFDDGGRLTTRSLYAEDDDAAEERPLPRSVAMRRPFERMVLEFEFDEARPAAVGAAAFQLRVAAGRDMIDISVDEVELPTAVPTSEEAQP